MSMHVRLKKYNGKRNLIRSYTAFGIKFLESRGWYKVEDDVAEYLATVTQRDGDPDSGAAFDVCTEAEAKRMDIEEARRKRAAEARRLGAEEAHDVTTVEDRRIHTPGPGRGDLTTRDLPRASAKDGFDDQPDTFDEKDMAGPRQTVATVPEAPDGPEDAPEPTPAPTPAKTSAGRARRR